MDRLLFVLALLAILGSGAIGGVFFAFSSFVMRALARLPAAQGVAAMQAINLTVLNRLFLGVFLGTAALALGAIVVAVLSWQHPQSLFHVSGGALYLLGSFFVTARCNVPLNEGLARVDPNGADVAAEWERYVGRWTRWNHLRTGTSLLAVLSFSLGLAW